MAYSDTLNELRSALDSYSENGEKLTALYKTALENADKAHKESMKQLNAQYRRDRNDVFADNARDERNTFNLLATRGLGFSGDAVQAKLNSNILLSNRLGELANSKNDSARELQQSLAEKSNNISLELADKQNELADKKNGLLADIAKAEQEKLMQEEALKAEKELEYAKLKAEKDMHEAELNAKYYNNTHVDGNSGNSNGIGNDSAGTDSDNTAQGFTPDISPKDLAKLMVTNATGSNYIDSEEDSYLVNKYLLDIMDNYGIGNEYAEELIFMLKAYGYEEISRSQMRVMVITHDAETYYNKKYTEYLNEYIPQTLNKSEARIYAASAAANDMMAYFYTNTKTEAEFLQCCEKLGISNEKAREYAAGKSWNGTAGGNGGTLGRIKTVNYLR